MKGATQFAGPPVWVSSIGSGQYDSVVMNPPFGKVGGGTLQRSEWEITKALMTRPVPIVALVPWFMLVNSSNRFRMLTEYGMDLVVNMPRNIFPRVRVQTCVVRLIPGAKPPAVLWHYEDRVKWQG